MERGTLMSRPPDGLDDSLIEPYDPYAGDAPEKVREQRWRAGTELHEEWGQQTRYEFSGQPQPCSDPVRWGVDLSVCGNCGRAIDAHPREVVEPLRDVKPYEVPLMRWFVKNGGIPDYYGGYDSGNSAIVRKHVLSECEVDLKKTKPPDEDVFSEFAGTFTSHSNSVEGVSSYLTCKCDKVHKLKWSIKTRISLGEMIFQVMKEDSDVAT
jgi:hypothetical protein